MHELSMHFTLASLIFLLGIADNWRVFLFSNKHYFLARKIFESHFMSGYNVISAVV